MIDLRSDTVTQPTPAMREAMMQARTGDDVFGEDPTVRELEEKAAALFDMEAALFCPSGTMTNQIAIRVHTNPGEEVITERYAHIYAFEGGGIAANSGASVRLLEGNRGRLDANQIEGAINPENDHFPRSRLVSLENTNDMGGGSVYDHYTIGSIHDTARQNGLKLHLDGARLFNAIIEGREGPEFFGHHFDSISICLSKGLGAPVGSVLIGDQGFIKEARRKRKFMGGGMRQAGILAGAGIHALDHHVERLKEDHQRARELGEAIKKLPFIEDIPPIDTNIVVLALKDAVDRDHYIQELEAQGLRVVPFGPGRVRMVTHLDLDDEMLDQAVSILKRTDPTTL